MKGFKKLILTSAILAASSSAFAMQALDEETMSATTGQDGLSITINSSTIADLDITWVDRQGFAGYSTDGGVQITNIGMNLTNLDILIDAGHDAGGNGSQLKIDFATTNNVVVSLNNTTISVGDASGVNTTNTTMASSADIIQFGGASTITITGGLSGSIKVGNRAAGEHLMSLNTTNPFDVVLNGGIKILDNGDAVTPQTDTGIGIGTITVSSVDLNTNIDVTSGATGGLRIDNSGTTIGQVSLETVKLGDLAAAAPDIGDVYLTGMTINSIMTIRGH